MTKHQEPEVPVAVEPGYDRKATTQAPTEARR
jgi:hypothetical protein